MEAIANRKSSQLAIGVRVRTKEAVISPDFPEISFENWTGEIVELSRFKLGTKFFVEWDQSTLERMPAQYVRNCEENQLYYRMACLGENEIEPTETDR